MAYRKEDIIKALDASMGAVYLAADKLGCSHTTILAWIKRSPDVAAIRDKWRGKLLDRAEIALYEKVQMKDNWAIGFALGKLGKNRGYADKREIEIKDEREIEGRIIAILEDLGIAGEDGSSEEA